jgi:hypothetical protein
LKDRVDQAPGILQPGCWCGAVVTTNDSPSRPTHTVVGHRHAGGAEGGEGDELLVAERGKVSGKNQLVTVVARGDPDSHGHLEGGGDTAADEVATTRHGSPVHRHG